MRLTKEAFEDCRERALALLDQRAHSTGELRAKLLKRGFEQALVKLVTDDLVRSGLVSDLDFARAFCDERLHGARPTGPARLKAELLRRHVPAELADEAVGAALGEGGADSEFESALAAGRRKWDALQGRPGSDARKDRDKVLRFLAGRGFGAAVCWRVVETLAQGASA